jgi:hypothetical protein
MPPTTIEETDSAYLDTVALLQEEIARLEDELRRRDEAAPEAPQQPSGQADEAAGARIAELSALLTEREETIGLLCEQLAALEEAGAARSAEWEQMDRWVRELEEKIEREGARPAAPDEDRRQAEALRERLEERERAWAAESAGMQQEITGLRSRLAEAPELSGDEARAALEAENHRLLDECRRLVELEGAAAETTVLRERLRDAKEQLAQARQALEQATDDLRRERLEREAETASLRASLAGARAARPAELSVDDRIKALTIHLREVHDREEQERAERQLFNRLSRLWRGPASR